MSQRDDAARSSRARIEAIVKGRVQGVGFRWFASRTASRLGLHGWVANEPDGSVRVVAEGSESALADLVEALERGPAGASVSEVHVERMVPTGSFDGFSIRSGGHRGD